MRKTTNIKIRMNTRDNREMEILSEKIKKHVVQIMYELGVVEIEVTEESTWKI